MVTYQHVNRVYGSQDAFEMYLMFVSDSKSVVST